MRRPLRRRSGSSVRHLPGGSYPFRVAFRSCHAAPKPLPRPRDNSARIRTASCANGRYLRNSPPQLRAAAIPLPDPRAGGSGINVPGPKLPVSIAEAQSCGFFRADTHACRRNLLGTMPAMRTLQPFDLAANLNPSCLEETPVINDVDEYKRVLPAVLRAHTDAALSKLQKINRCLPEKTRGIRIMVHLPQDADGMFSVMVHLDGPDSFVLDKAIGDFRSLFDVRVVHGAVTPHVPLFDPFD